MSIPAILPVKELNFEPITKLLVSKVEYTKISPQVSGNVTISTSAVESIFELPPRVFNLAKSHLSFNLSVGAQGASTYSWTNLLSFGVRQIQLYSRSGVFLCDINNLQQYMNVINPIETNKADAAFYDDNYHLLNNTPSRGTDTIYRHDNSAISTSPYEPYYYAISASNTARDIDVNIPLSIIKNSIFEMDKSLYFNESLLIKLVWSTRDECGFIAASDTNATSTPAILTANITVSNLYLFLALERNIRLAEAVIEKTLVTGNLINVPFVYVYKNIPGASTNQAISIRLNRSNGTHLKKIYHTIFHQTETLNTRYDHQARATSYYTAVNNQRLQQFDLKSSDFTDYMYLYDDILKQSLLDNFDVFDHNWVHVDKFEDPDAEDPNTNITSGLPLDIEQKWDISITCSATAFNHYTFAITNRNLIITAAGILFA